ncbi:MAG: protein kinase [Verrucomicrobiae bacterium]|nr:protein kinase [Verrucomicrobiae bacterium]
MATETTCPHCGKPVPATALEGICPECMLQAGLAETGEVGPGGMAAAKPTRPVPTIEEITPHFPQLEILECLGRGGMGVVYKARQPKLDRFVALKILIRSRDSGISDTEFTARFQQEARALARLSHPDIVAVYDFGEAGGFHYLLMEYVDGLALRQLLQRKKLSPEEALTIVPKICEALQFAHERGIVHRDIKPENILLDKQGRVKIADFGIAKILGAQATGASLTGAKDRLGTPHYMAPEQVETPQKVDHRADIYSLGVVFYEMLTGELPLGKFQSPSKKVQVDVRLDEVVLHALEKEPERRYQHASEVKTDVETIAASPPNKTAGVSGPAPAPAPRAFQRWFAPLVVVREGRRVIHWPGVAQDAFMLAGIYCVAWLLVVTLLSPVIGTLHAGFLVGGLLGFLIAMFAFGFYRSFKLPVAQLKKLDVPAPESSAAAQRPRSALQSLLAAMLLIASLGGWVLCGFWVYVQPLIVERAAAQNTVLTGGQRVMLQLGDLAHTYDWLLLPMLVLASGIALLWLMLAGSQRHFRPWGAVRDAARAGLSRRAAEPQQASSPWVVGARWMARILGTLLLAFFGMFILAEGLPPIASQPEGVQLNFVALGLILAGFLAGWKREGTAALLIASGWTLWQISEGRIKWNLFQTPLPVAALYGFCWWATRGRRTGVVAGTVIALALALGLGQLFVPTSVFVRGAVVDAQTGQPVANAELRLLPRSARAREKGDPADARADQNGRFTLYVGWYAEGKPVAISAPDHTTLTTNLGPRALGIRSVSRDFALQPAAGGRPAKVGFDEIRAVALFNHIEDFGHEFDAAFTATNLAAARTGTRRLLELLTNFNAVVQGTDLEFPVGIFNDIAKVRRALDEGDWEKVRRLAQHNEEYARAFRRIGERMADLAREQQRSVAHSSPVNGSMEIPPPVVVKTVPEAGAADVDPALSEIRVTFSKDMLTNQMWAFCQVSEETFPERVGEIHYVDLRTCVLPVKLRPGRTYALWINLERFDSFRDAQNHPALPYPLFFQTRPLASTTK